MDIIICNYGQLIKTIFVVHSHKIRLKPLLVTELEKLDAVINSKYEPPLTLKYRKTRNTILLRLCVWYINASYYESVVVLFE